MKTLLIALSLIVTSTSFAETAVYHCTPSANNSSTNEFVLTHSSAGLTLKDGDAGREFPMTLDTTYRPRANNANLNRYNCNFSLDDEYQSVFMVSKNVEQNASTVVLKIFSRGEGFFNDFFTCKR